MTITRRRALQLAGAASLFNPGPLRADENPDWTAPLAPFQIAEGLYYVGSRDLASYLITTSAGNILLNSNLESSVPQIRHSVEQLGFRWGDTRLLLISHAHFDHAAGSAAVIAQTQARYMVMDGDVSTVESGGRMDFAYGPKLQFPPAHVERVLHDGDTVALGGTVLTAHKTAGHTRGCTTWTLRVREPAGVANQPKGSESNGSYDVVIVGSWNVNPGFRLVAAPGRPASYPGIAQDYAHTFVVLRGLPCDLFLGAHGLYFNMLAKLARLPKEGRAVWIDSQGYRRAVEERQAAFERELQRQENKTSGSHG